MSTTKKITIDIPEGKTARWIDEVLTLVDETPKDVTERIKSFEDARKELGNAHPLVEEYETVTARCGGLTDDLLAYLKLRIIVTALNEGWKPKFTESEWRYYPWFWFYTQDEINDMKCEEKQKCNLQLRKIGHYAGFACADSNDVPSYADASIGSRLCLKNSELASYCGTQFIEIWSDFILR